jgi:quercetin dioxygenase-like cupin family protein
MSDGSSLPARRVVTGHNEQGRARVLWDAPVEVVRRAEPPHRTQVSVVWSTHENPADVAIGLAIDDAAKRVVGTQPPPNGSRVSVLDLPPGSPGGLHRTESIDYAFVLAGEVDMELDDGVRVALNAGDIVVQRATNHSWSNRGSTWARIAVVLIDAVPLGIGEPVASGSFASEVRRPD